MGAIRNTSKADINVSTEAGVFVFPAGKVKGDLAAERVAEIEAAGAVYFTAGELVTEAGEQPAKDADADGEEDKPKAAKKK